MQLQPTLGAPSNFPFERGAVMRCLGLNKDEERLLRKNALTRSDWVKHKKRVFLSAGAVARLATAAKAPVPEKSAPASPSSIGAQPDTVKTTSPEKGAPAQSAPESEVPTKAPEPAPDVRLLVVRADLANKRMLLCCPAGQDPDRPKQTVRVRVKSTENFRRRMEVPARLVPGYKDLYDLARALPRKKGVW